MLSPLLNYHNIFIRYFPFDCLYIILCDNITENNPYLIYDMYVKGVIDMTIKHITNENFKQEVLQSEKPVLIDFFATWCGPCKMLAPIIEQIANEKDDIKVVKIDVDQEMELARQFGIMSIPTLIVIKDGKVANTSLGYKSKEAILNMI